MTSTSDQSVSRQSYDNATTSARYYRLLSSVEYADGRLGVQSPINDKKSGPNSIAKYRDACKCHCQWPWHCRLCQGHWHLQESQWLYLDLPSSQILKTYGARCKPCILSHISVEAQSTLGGQDIFTRKYMHEKLTKCPNFTWFLPEKYFFSIFGPLYLRLLRLCCHTRDTPIWLIIS